MVHTHEQPAANYAVPCITGEVKHLNGAHTQPTNFMRERYQAGWLCVCVHMLNLNNCEVCVRVLYM